MEPEPTCDGEYRLGTVVTVTAVPTDGYVFVRWGGDLDGVTASPTEIEIVENMSITAVFREDSSGIPWWAWTLVGIGVLGGAAGFTYLKRRQREG